jgi:Na+/H+-translocating membrane pyrophosphatase
MTKTDAMVHIVAGMGARGSSVQDVLIRAKAIMLELEQAGCAWDTCKAPEVIEEKAKPEVKKAKERSESND